MLLTCANTPFFVLLSRSKVSRQARVISLIGLIFKGDLTPLGERLPCSNRAPTGSVRVTDLTASREQPLEVLHLQARLRHSTGDDLRAVDTARALDYQEALLSPAVAAASVLHHVFPVAANQTSLRLDASSSPVSFHIGQVGSIHPGTPTAER